MDAKNNQANNQANQQSNQDLQKTVVNGKVVSLKQAQQMQEQFEKQNNQTGIQAHHNNQSESVQAGETAQNSNLVNSQVEMNVKQTEVQSGQSHLAGSSAGMTQEQQMQQADHDSVQGSVDADAKSKAKANKK